MGYPRVLLLYPPEHGVSTGDAWVVPVLSSMSTVAWIPVSTQAGLWQRKTEEEKIYT
jgi:hypothetical protein